MTLKAIIRIDEDGIFLMDARQRIRYREIACVRDGTFVSESQMLDKRVSSNDQASERFVSTYWKTVAEIVR